MGLINNVNVNVGGNGNIIDTLSTYVTKLLKPNIIDGENVLTQSMMSAANTKYVIKYDYVLGEGITVPANCILEFDGGSIDNNNNNIILNNDTVIVDIKNSVCTTDTRPTLVSIGFQTFDKTIGKPIWYNGSNWVDATGVIV